MLSFLKGSSFISVTASRTFSFSSQAPKLKSLAVYSCPSTNGNEYRDSNIDVRESELVATHQLDVPTAFGAYALLNAIKAASSSSFGSSCGFIPTGLMRMLFNAFC